MNFRPQPPLLRLPIVLGLALAGYIVFVRLLPYVVEAAGMSIDPNFGAYPWNFSPVMAICLFGGSRFFRHRGAWLVSFGGMLVSDLAILALKGPAFAFSWITPAVYLSFALGIWIGHRMRRESRPGKLLAGAGIAEITFFLVTNFFVWLVFHHQPPMYYTLDLAGLGRCYLNAVPFFGRSLAATLFYGGLLFGTWAWISSRAGARTKQNDWMVVER